jgi:hypothetical protein
MVTAIAILSPIALALAVVLFEQARHERLYLERTDLSRYDRLPGSPSPGAYPETGSTTGGGEV